MSKKILVVQGHPDRDAHHFGHALAEAYGSGAVASGHEVQVVTVAQLDVPLLRSQAEWETGALSSGLADAQRLIGWADHLVFIFPLWLGTMPALVKAFLEQVLRPGFAFRSAAHGSPGRPALGGKSARIIVTMGMPAFVYRWVFRAHGVEGLKRNVLHFVGIKPVRETFIGLVADENGAARAAWLEKIQTLGRKAS